MSVVRSLTFEKRVGGDPPGDLYDITTSIPCGTMVLSSARVDFLLPPPVEYADIPKSLSLEIGTIVGNTFVVDNDVERNYFKVILNTNIVQIGGVSYLSSLTYPNTSFKMNGDLSRQCVFRIRDEFGEELEAEYFCFHFTVISPI